MEIKKQLLESLKNFTSLPILFVGSGMSIRYLGLKNWEELLRYFAHLARDHELSFEQYRNEVVTEYHVTSKADIYPKIAQLIEKDFNKKWFSDDKYQKSREENIDLIRQGVSPFKIEIANFIKKNQEVVQQGDLKKELDLLKEVGKKSISGVITTNYDQLFENLFGYDTFIGQEELVFSPVQGISEIYKIHGCCTKPQSIVITDEDYKEFDRKNTYLAAKLMTLFMEHPIIFMGYSLSDNDVNKILEAIINCITTEENLKRLKDRLFIVEWNNTVKEDEITIHSKQFGDKNIEFTRIFVKDYSVLYEVLLKNKSRYSTRILKKLKDDIYQLVLTNDPTQKIKVVGIENEDKLDDVDVVLGVGILERFGLKGILGIKPEELFYDVVRNEDNFFNIANFDLDYFVKESLPDLLKFNANSLPIYKYIRDYNIDDLPQRVQDAMKDNFDSFLNNTIRKTKQRTTIEETSIDEVVNNYGLLGAIQKIVLLDEKNIVCDELKTYLQKVFEQHPDILANGGSLDKTEFRRLIKIYDWLRYSDYSS